MPPKQKFTQEEWKSHRTELERLYTNEGKKLREIMAEMGEKYNFWPSKSQYETAFKKWDFRKNLTESEWGFDNQRTKKRKAGNKESEVYLNGALIPAKKVKKELDRYFPPCFQQPYSEAASPQTPPHISVLTPRDMDIEPSPDIALIDIDVQIPHYIAVQTPKNLSISEIRLDTLPWFQFQGFLESHSMISRSQSLMNEIANMATQISHTKKSHVRPPLLSFLGKVTSTLSALDYNIQQNLSPAQLRSIESIMQDNLLERNPGDFQLSIKKLLGPFDSDALIEFLRYLPYLASNDMLSNDQCDQFLQWVIETNNRSALEAVLSVKVPIIHAFARCLLGSALRIMDAAILRVLLKAGVDPDLPMRDGITPLQAAVESRSMELARILLDARVDVNIRTKVTDQHHIERRQTALSLAVMIGGIEMIKMLLDAGANTETLVHGDLTRDNAYCSGTPLQRAAAVGNVKLVRLLLDAGANVDSQRVWFQEATVLQKVASGGSHGLSIELARLLLDAGADVNAPGFSNDSALCWAANKGQVEIARILLDSGADVNHWDADQCTPLISAAGSLSPSIAMVRMLLVAGAHVNTPFPYRSALGGAVSQYNFEIVRVLLDAGADVNSPAAPSLNNPLTMAACCGNVEIVRMLLHSGAEVNARTASTTLLPGYNDIDSDSNEHDGDIDFDSDEDCDDIDSDSEDLRSSALQQAVESGNVQIVQMLLAAGADVNCPADSVGYKPLKEAARQGSAEIVQMLLDSGAEVNAGSGSKELQDLYSLDESDRVYGSTALQAAAKRGSVEIVRMLLSAGADVKAAENSPLPWAARTDWLQIMLESGMRDLLGLETLSDKEILSDLMHEAIRKGAIDFDRENTLTSVIKSNQNLLVQVLLDAGADINAMDWYNRTSLELAINSGYGFLAEPLLKAGADVNVFSPSNGRTALGAAVKKNDINLVKKLLGAIAKAEVGHSPLTNLRNRVVSDALPLAARNGNIEIVQLLISSGADVNASAKFKASRGEYGCVVYGELVMRSALLCAAWSGNISLVEVLLNAGANVNTGPESYPGWTALQAAAYCGNAEMVQILLDSGGRTALQAAVVESHMELVPSLLMAGADVNAPAAELQGVTALQGAAIKGHLVIAHTLIKAGADPNAPPAKCEGRTALQGAAEHGRLDMVELLIQARADISDLKRASELAKENRHFVIVEYLKTHYNMGAM